MVKNEILKNCQPQYPKLLLKMETCGFYFMKIQRHLTW